MVINGDFMEKTPSVDQCVTMCNQHAVVTSVPACFVGDIIVFVALMAFFAAIPIPSGKLT